MRPSDLLITLNALPFVLDYDLQTNIWFIKSGCLIGYILRTINTTYNMYLLNTNDLKHFVTKDSLNFILEKNALPSVIILLHYDIHLLKHASLDLI